MVAAQGLTALLFLIAARTLGTYDFGVAMASYGIAITSAAILDFGAATHHVKALSQGHRSNYILTQRFRYTLIYCLLLIAPFWIALKPAAHLAAAAIFVALTTAANLTASAPVKAQQRFSIVALTLILERLVALACFIILYLAGSASPATLLLSLALGGLFSSTLASLLGKAQTTFRPQFPRRSMWRGGLYFGIQSLGNALSALDSVVIVGTAGASTAGLYSSVSRWAAPIGLLATAIAQSRFPVMSAAPDQASARRVLRRGLIMLLAPTALAIIIAASAPALVPTLLGRQFEPAAPLLSGLAIALVPAFANQLYSLYLLSRTSGQRSAQTVVTMTIMQLLGLALLGWIEAPLATYSIPFFAAQTLMLIILSREVRRTRT